MTEDFVETMMNNTETEIKADAVADYEKAKAESAEIVSTISSETDTHLASLEERLVTWVKSVIKKVRDEL